MRTALRRVATSSASCRICCIRGFFVITGFHDVLERILASRPMFQCVFISFLVVSARVFGTAAICMSCSIRRARACKQQIGIGRHAVERVSSRGADQPVRVFGAAADSARKNSGEYSLRNVPFVPSPAIVARRTLGMMHWDASDVLARPHEPRHSAECSRLNQSSSSPRPLLNNTRYNAAIETFVA